MCLLYQKPYNIFIQTWMCGGSLEIIPCSHVGHMFRNAMPYSWGDNGMQILIKNSLRLAEVWMDEYKKLYHDRIFYNINVSLSNYFNFTILIF
jgi:polypeptide N-acetylgalactosaminyltransferase